MKRATKTDPKIRKRRILDAALAVACKIGHKCLTRDKVAAAASVSGPLVAKYFTSMVKLRQTVLRTAIKHEILPILAHCVADEELLFHPKLRRVTLEYIGSKL